MSSVAVTSPSPGRPDPAPIERRTAVHLHSDGTATLGDHHAADGSTSSFVEFVDRLGRATGVRANDGSLSRAEDLVATAMECLLADAMTLIGDERYTAVATHPTEWPPSTVAVLRNALDYVGLRHVSLISDAEAAAAWFESQVAHQTGRLVAVYHIDPEGTTVTLVRSGVTAGKSFRFPEGEAPSVTAQLSAALGAFGWLVSNLDAVVVTVDEAMDPVAAQLVTQSIKAGLGVRCALAPEPHQTMVRGAALAAAAGSVDLLGSTQVLPVTRVTATPRNQLDTDATTVIAKITATPPAAETPSKAQAPSKATPSAPPEEEKDDNSGKSRSPLFAAGAAAAAVALLVAVGVLVLTLRDSSTASANTPVPETTRMPLIADRSSTTTPAPTTTTPTCFVDHGDHHAPRSDQRSGCTGGPAADVGRLGDQQFQRIVEQRFEQHRAEQHPVEHDNDHHRMVTPEPAAHTQRQRRGIVHAVVDDVENHRGDPHRPGRGPRPRHRPRATLRHDLAGRGRGVAE
ncbi:Hsp70 family protein [Rhodococcus chondri]|uniref:DUF7159 domain-containing protein n=1 Tax=Rhodococcus chondri TaxID=3065941 RepID=A0ABU7JWC3_9NOCA|nr:hypothetical protein [Rhodococcus sp. CC-R104]MEE2034307.1 hypothetical protein [Rhodococcus sp. CC-R104]